MSYGRTPEVAGLPLSIVLLLGVTILIQHQNVLIWIIELKSRISDFLIASGKKKKKDTSKMAQLHFEILLLCRQRQSADWYYLLISGHRVPLNTEVSNSPHSCSIQTEGSLCRPVPCATLILHRCFLTPGLSSSSRFLLPSTGTSDLLLCPLPFLLRGGSEGEGGGRKTQDAVAETPS